MKPTQIVVMVMLCFLPNAKAQTNKAIDKVSTGIRIGDMIPDVNLKNIHNYPSPYARISDFKGKLIIIDFWATWCSPCLTMIPKMDSLQRQFSDKIQFISVTYQPQNEVVSFLKKFEAQQGIHTAIPIITDDDTLGKLFPHTTLPHYVWIDGDSKVIAITDFKAITQENIRKVLMGNDALLPTKKDLTVNYDPKQPLFINNNGGSTDNLLFHTLLTGYNPALSAGYDIGKTPEINGRRMVFTNENLINLFAFAYGEGKMLITPNRMQVNVSDRSPLFFKSSTLTATEWIEKNQYCYEIWVPPHMETNIYGLMKDNLSKLFPQYKASLKRLKRKCFVLERKQSEKSFEYTGGQNISEFTRFGFNINGYYMARLINQLNVGFLQDAKYPIIDGTGYDGRISIQAEADLTDLVSINASIEKYGLIFNLKEMEIEILLIEDNIIKN